jgi:hypothetical protein
VAENVGVPGVWPGGGWSSHTCSGSSRPLFAVAAIERRRPRAARASPAGSSYSPVCTTLPGVLAVALRQSIRWSACRSVQPSLAFVASYATRPRPRSSSPVFDSAGSAST